MGGDFIGLMIIVWVYKCFYWSENFCKDILGSLGGFIGLLESNVEIFVVESIVFGIVCIG